MAFLTLLWTWQVHPWFAPKGPVPELATKKTDNVKEVTEITVKFYQGCSKVFEWSLIKINHHQSFKHAQKINYDWSYWLLKVAVVSWIFVADWLLIGMYCSAISSAVWLWNVNNFFVTYCQLSGSRLVTGWWWIIGERVTDWQVISDYMRLVGIWSGSGYDRLQGGFKGGLIDCWIFPVPISEKSCCFNHRKVSDRSLTSWENGGWLWGVLLVREHIGRGKVVAMIIKVAKSVTKQLHYSHKLCGSEALQSQCIRAPDTYKWGIWG